MLTSAIIQDPCTSFMWNCSTGGHLSQSKIPTHVSVTILSQLIDSEMRKILFNWHKQFCKTQK